MDPRVADAVWKAIEGHLPPRPPDMHPLGCHRLRIPDRDCFDGILARLVTGCSWDVAARLCRQVRPPCAPGAPNGSPLGSSTSSSKKPSTATTRSSAWTYPRSPSTAACTKPRAAVKGPAPTPPTEPRPGGSGRSRPTCSPIPIGWVIDAANRHDSVLLEPTLPAVANRGLLADVQALHLDRGYDSFLTTQRCHSPGLTDIVCAKKKRKGEAKTKKPLTLGPRWPVERTSS